MDGGVARQCQREHRHADRTENENRPSRRPCPRPLATRALNASKRVRWDSDVDVTDEHAAGTRIQIQSSMSLFAPELRMYLV